MVLTAIFTSAFRTIEKGNVMMLMMTTKNKRLEMKKVAGSDS